jgi:hypothetical protein
MKKYYLYNGARQFGPFTLAELKHQHLHRDTHVWYEGLNEWVKAGTVPELQELLPPATPPPFIISNNDAQTPATSFNAPASSRLKARFVNKVIFIVSILLLILLVLVIVAVRLN